MSKRCDICFKENTDDREVCEFCGGTLGKARSKPNVVHDKEHKNSSHETMNQEKMNLKTYPMTRIDQLETYVILLLLILGIGTIITFIYLLINERFGVAVITLVLSSIGLYVQYVIYMALVEHLQNGQASKRELSKIREILSQQQEKNAE